LTKTGEGTLSLTTSASTFAGDINVNSGTLTVLNATVSNPVGNTNVNFGGTLTVQGNSTMSSVVGNTNVNLGGTLTVQGRSTLSTTVGNANVNGGTMTIQGASSVSDAKGVIAGGPLAGTVMVTDTSSWTNSSNLDVGQSGTGTLSVQRVSKVSSTGIGIIGDASGSTGSVTVTDFGSTWTSGSQIEVGSFGTGTLTIGNGGVVSDANSGIMAVSGTKPARVAP
jgi:fibronectin-binding autotransporter adhesin